MAFNIGSAAPLIGAAYNLTIDRKEEDRRQLEQQKKLNQDQLDKNREAAKYSSDLQYEMWKKTNYGAQRAEIEDAGLNPALLYGMSGNGGSTGSASAGGVSGGQAASAAATQQNKLAMGMQLAQTALMTAQAEKTNAETDNLKAGTERTGVQTEGERARVTAQEFQNAINSQIGVQNFAERWAKETDKIELEASRMNAEWEAFQAAGFKGKSFDDPNSPLAKALTAGWEKSVTDLANAKKDGNIKEATAAIETYKANLAKQGISPDSPWYVKLLGDLMEKVGMPLQKGTEAVKTITQ